MTAPCDQPRKPRTEEELLELAAQAAVLHDRPREVVARLYKTYHRPDAVTCQFKCGTCQAITERVVVVDEHGVPLVCIIPCPECREKYRLDRSLPYGIAERIT
jgi:hypothetical protein